MCCLLFGKYSSVTNVCNANISLSDGDHGMENVPWYNLNNLCLKCNNIYLDPFVKTHILFENDLAFVVSKEAVCNRKCRTTSTSDATADRSKSRILQYFPFQGANFRKHCIFLYNLLYFELFLTNIKRKWKFIRSLHQLCMRAEEYFCDESFEKFVTIWQGEGWKIWHSKGEIVCLLAVNRYQDRSLSMDKCVEDTLT